MIMNEDEINKNFLGLIDDLDNKYKYTTSISSKEYFAEMENILIQRKKALNQEKLLPVKNYWEELYKSKSAAIMKVINKYRLTKEDDPLLVAADCLIEIDEILNAEG